MFGNHFVGLIKLEDSDGQLAGDHLYLCVHSGSRKYGVHVKSLFTDDMIKMDTNTFNKFMNHHNKCVEWTKLNRELIAKKFCKASSLSIKDKMHQLTHNFIEKGGKMTKDLVDDRLIDMIITSMLWVNLGHH